jgi:hypothetical protein
MEKLYFTSDALIYEFNTCKIETLGDEFPSFMRRIAVVMAHPGVNAQDILNEVQKIEDDIELGNLHPTIGVHKTLTTTLSEYPHFVLALTYQGFVRIADGLKNDGVPTLRRERFKILANALIRNRDSGDFTKTDF